MRERSSPISERVVRAVATYTDTDPLELPPLYDAIDPDALNALVSELSGGGLSFQYAGHSVTVESSSTIQVDDCLIDSGSSEDQASELPD